MAQIRPFHGIHYAKRRDLDLSAVIAPPYDVIDERRRTELQGRHPHNIVNVDLPHLPVKTVGPAGVYDKANLTLQAWLKAGILKRDVRPALYPYAQSFDYHGRTFHRRGFLALVRLSPFGAGQVVPHEKTYDGPIEDRLKLMRATRVQLSPIFGLYHDPRNEVTGALYHSLGRPEYSGTLDGVKNDLWSVTDAEIENKVIDLMGTKPIYIADGHHRYTTALQYQKEVVEREPRAVPPAHPSNWCLFNLVSMQDDGLLILPTHRMIGGLDAFDPKAFIALLGNDWEVKETTIPDSDLGEFATANLLNQPQHTFGLFNGTARKLYELRLKNLDILAPLEPKHSEAWRRLDVAILQRYLLEEVLWPKFAAGKQLTRSYTPDANAVAALTDGKRNQIAILLRPTPLSALQQLGEHNEVMPQKSTYFYPKLATGMIINPLE